MTITKQERQCL